MIHLSYNGKLYSYDNKTSTTATSTSGVLIVIHPYVGIDGASLYYKQEDIEGFVRIVDNAATIPSSYLVTGDIQVAISLASGELSNMFAIGVTKISSNSNITDDDIQFTMDNKKRLILVPGSQPLLAIQYDNSSEIITFKLPRYQEGIDLSTKAAYVNYRAPQTSDKGKSLCTISNVEEDTLQLSWLVTGAVTQYEGEVYFQIEFSSSDGYRWQSQIAKLPILTSLYNTGLEPYAPGILEQYLQQFQDFAQRAQTSKLNAEAYAVGTRDGIPVEQGDITHHNNAKYYAEQAKETVEETARYALSAFPTDTVSGSIVSFLDGADDIPVKDLSVGIEPVQDLHGYDHPWPGGDGKNILDVEGRTVSGAQTPATIRGENCNITKAGDTLICTTTGPWSKVWMELDKSTLINGQTYTVSAHFSNPGADRIGVAWFDTVWHDLVLSSDASVKLETSFTFDSSQVRIVLEFVTNNTASNTGNTVVISEMQLELGSTATAFEPYENICQITGWTGAKVTRTGKNLLPKFSNRTDNGVTVTVNDDGSVTLSGTATANAYFSVDNNDLPIGDYIFSFNNPVANSGVHISFHNANNAYFGDSTADSVNKTLRLQSREPSTTILYVTRGVTLTNFVVKPQLELGSTATDYEPYQGDIYSITFPAASGTVYGGTLAVVSGKLVVNSIGEQFTSAEYYGNYGSENAPLYYCERTRPERIKPYWYNAQTTLLLSNYFRKSSSFSDAALPDCEMRTNASGNPRRFYFRWDSNTLANINSAFAETPFFVIAELATPIVYDLTPQEITTILGQNNVWADAGDVTVTYRADPVKFIDRKLATLLENA